MRFVYSRRNWTTRERGEENCYLVTNGLGGFSSATMIGSNTRSDHSFLMACMKAPNHRYNMIHRLEEVIEYQGESIHLSSQKYVNKSKNEEGHRYLDGFCFEDYPRWIYRVDGIRIIKEIAMKQGENLAAVRYQIYNDSKEDILFKMTPHLQFTLKGRQIDVTQPFTMSAESPMNDCKGQAVQSGNIVSGALKVCFATNGEIICFPGKYITGLYYAYDDRDGRNPVGNAYINHHIEKNVAPGEHSLLEIIYGMEEIHQSADEIFHDAVNYRRKLANDCNMKSDIAKVLAKSAGQFVTKRESTGGKTILAGYPFFEDWGRDTMIAVAGCCIASGQFKAAKSIFRTFTAYCREGLMPNLFPEGGNEPMYNSADASLLFIHSIYLYYKKTGDLAFVEEMWPAMSQIIRWYIEGTAYGIHMDEDGLIMAGKELDQVTWMDVRIGGILPTPRHGKPVEINVYWYQALCIMDTFMSILVKEKGLETPKIKNRKINYSELSLKVQKSFREKFWNEENGCLKDVLSGTAAEDQIRCNQIWAVSMPFSILTEEQEKQIVRVVSEKLYTPYGLRTLAKEDPEFHAVYGGPQVERDLAYHQGTIWVFPLGAFYLAYLKVNQYSCEALDTVKKQLEILEGSLWEGCIGQLPEIYDGESPVFSRGCFAQAWSVGEILRVYEALEEYGKD